MLFLFSLSQYKNIYVKACIWVCIVSLTVQEYDSSIVLHFCIALRKNENEN